MPKYFNDIMENNPFEEEELIRLALKKVIEVAYAGAFTIEKLHKQFHISPFICITILDVLVQEKIIKFSGEKYHRDENFEIWYLSNRNKIFTQTVDLRDCFAFLAEEPTGSLIDDLLDMKISN